MCRFLYVCACLLLTVLIPGGCGSDRQRPVREETNGRREGGETGNLGDEINNWKELLQSQDWNGLGPPPRESEKGAIGLQYKENGNYYPAVYVYDENSPDTVTAIAYYRSTNHDVVVRDKNGEILAEVSRITLAERPGKTMGTVELVVDEVFESAGKALSVSENIREAAAKAYARVDVLLTLGLYYKENGELYPARYVLKGEGKAAKVVGVAYWKGPAMLVRDAKGRIVKIE